MGKLNAKVVQNAKHSGPGFATLRDGDGLELRVRASGTKTWFLRYQFQGQRRVPRIGDYGDGEGLLTLKQARDVAEDMRRKLREGVDPVEEQKRIDAERKAAEEAERARLEAERLALENRRTFAKALDRWAELELSKRKDGGAESLRALRKDVVPVLGNRTLTEVGRGDVVDILDSITSRGSRIMANRVFGDLRQFFNWCDTREWIDRNPLRGITKERIGGRETERDRVLSPDELVELRDKLPSANLELQTEAAIWIMLSTLCRVGELIQAQWADVNFEASTWRIPPGNSKNAREHLVYLSPFALRWFRALHKRTKWSDWVLPSVLKDGEHVCLKSITKQLRDRMRDTPMSNRTKATGALILSEGTWTAHDLRRTGATLMGERGVLSEIIERCLNHVEPSKIRRTYQRHEYKAEKRDAWERLGAYLDEQLNGTARIVVNIGEAIR
ncbi:tyrosine-type recombinase/integrase [Acidihalobacter prosperus]|uniref:Integrase n=1 Tax=Acidihalobacter prosperus TaxID=160660 RepID=A0A1A6C6G0_9GAMM|nr:site-specific integrase [Acidihalobacter prosperus]OBS10152.1 hypothetical protein Thpro_021202 [Acidihalobacter prosperus]